LSPSGFEMRKDWEGADVVLYLPLDTQKNAVDFVQLLNPRVALFVKYEFWMNLLGVLKQKNVPTVLVSGIFRPSHVFLKPYGGWFRSRMKAFSHAFMQNEESCVLAKQIGISADLSGDTRFDRVLDIAAHSFSVEMVKTFKGESVCVVAGSSWGPEEKALLTFAKGNPSVKLVIVPHEIGEGHLQQIEASFGNMISRFSGINRGIAESRQVLLVDQMGLLSRIFREADIALIGGGFGAGIHNTLEAAVYGVPVVFGPNYEKFIEAKGLIANGGAVCVQEPHKLTNVLESLVSDDVQRKERGAKAKAYVAERSGATLQVVSYLAENELV
jgi:3-deoxy-D-manno-octulosonic-acid transferase